MDRLGLQRQCVLYNDTSFDYFCRCPNILITNIRLLSYTETNATRASIHV